MKLNLKKPIVFFDLETTGINVSTDRIVEICYIKVMPNGNELSRTMRINPEMSIPKEASDVHGITNDDVKDCPTFKEVAREIAKDFEACWKEYPKKEGKQKARRAFEKAIRGIGTRKPNGEPYTAAEILAETILYRQYIEKRLDHDEIEYRYIPSGGSWFEREGWTDETPSISSSFEDMLDGMTYNKNMGDLRRYATMLGKAPAEEKPTIWQRIQQIRAALPY